MAHTHAKLCSQIPVANKQTQARPKSKRAQLKKVAAVRGAMKLKLGQKGCHFSVCFFRCQSQRVGGRHCDASLGCFSIEFRHTYFPGFELF